MAKVCMIERDIKRKKTAKNKAPWLQSWKADVKAIRAREAKGEEVSFDEKMTLAFRRQKKPRNISPARIRNRCSQTGRPRSVYRKFMLCRNQLRELGSKGLIPGLRKSSW